MKSIFIDTDVFVMDLRYKSDKNFSSNQQFLDCLKKKKFKAVTSVFNVLEIFGIVSFNLSDAELLRLYEEFPKQYGVKFLFPADRTGELKYDFSRIFRNIQKKQSLGDAQVAYVVEQFQNMVSTFVSWNAKHFAGKLPVPVMTPKEFLARGIK